MLALGKHQKMSTVTSSSNLWLRGQRSNFIKCRRNMRLCSDLFTGLVSSSSSSFFFCQYFFDLYLGHDLTDFDHYYALRIFHLYKCTVNENTNKSVYWYTSHKSSIPGFAKPGIVAEICPSGLSILPISPLIGSH